MFNQIKTKEMENSMFDWITKIFASKPNERTELSDDEKKRSADDFMNQTIIFPSANQAINPNSSSESSDSGSSDGGGSACD